MIVGDELYVIGGWNGQSILKDVRYSHILPTGQLEHNWIPTTQLEPGRIGHAAVSYGQIIYVIGGRVNDGQGNRVATDSVQYAFVDDGIVGMWKDTTRLRKKLSDMSAVVSEDGVIYVIGGRNADFVSNKVYSATILNSTGELSEWEDISATRGLTLPLASGLHGHTAVYSNFGSIYILGGRTNNLGENPPQYVANTYYIPPLTLTKSNDPPGPVHEGDNFSYTIAYANTSLINQTITITDIIPFNTTLIPDSVTPPITPDGSLLTWNIGPVPPGAGGQVSFQVRVALLPSFQPTARQTVAGAAAGPAYVLPARVSCDSTVFWASGVTRQPPEPVPHTVQVQMPPGAQPSEMWLMMKGTDNISPTVAGQPATLVTTTTHSFGASLWTTPITPGMVISDQVTIVTQNPRELNAVFLFDEADPPFVETKLEDFFNTTKTFTYPLELPSVVSQSIDVIMPFMDITVLKDDFDPDDRPTQIEMEFNGQAYRRTVSNPNMDNGLFMAQFPFEIGTLDTPTTTQVLTVTIDTADSVYTLGPRVCRPVYVENTAWLCSLEAGCISSTVQNVPGGFRLQGGVFLPIIMKP